MRNTIPMLVFITFVRMSSEGKGKQFDYCNDLLRYMVEIHSQAKPMPIEQNWLEHVTEHLLMHLK